MTKKIINSLLTASIKSIIEILENNEDKNTKSLKKNYEDLKVIITDFKDENIYQKIEKSWETKKTLVVSIGEDIVENGDYFEIDPNNSSTLEEFLEKIEELLFIIIILHKKSSGIVNINNGNKITKIKYHNAVEKKELDNISYNVLGSQYVL
jgi:hypothetical protein